jgi:phosphatidylserine/phosphatidylglycerophosphate/cardiolipin synthase-like enzyme
MRYGCVVLACGILGSTLSSFARSTSSGIDVYFNHSSQSQYTDPYRHITRAGDDFESIILKEINQAQTSLDIAVQELRLPSIPLALQKKLMAGVKVRLVIENSYNHPMRYKTLSEVNAITDPLRHEHALDAFRFIDTNSDNVLSYSEIAARDAIAMLANFKIPYIDDTNDGSRGSGLMHHKFIIVDGTRVLVTSANFTLSDIHGDFTASQTRGNANAMILASDRNLAQKFEEEFEILWGQGPGRSSSLFGLKKPFRGASSLSLRSGTAIKLQFSPSSTSEGRVPFEQSTNGLITKTISSARQEANMALFVFSEQRMANELSRVHSAGARIGALIEPSFAYRWYSEMLDLLGFKMLSPSCKFEAANQPWANPISTAGIPQIPKGDKLHHKFAVIDHQKVIFGSHNWSYSANHQNDETLLVIDNAEVAALFEGEYRRLEQGAHLGIPAWLVKRADDEARACQSHPNFGNSEGDQNTGDASGSTDDDESD